MTFTVLLKDSGCLGVPCRSEGGASMILLPAKRHSRAAALCSKTKCGRALEIPAHLHAAGICLQHLQVSVCILHLWALSRRAIKNRMFLQRNKQHQRHLLLAVPLSHSCFRQL